MTDIHELVFQAFDGATLGGNALHFAEKFRPGAFILFSKNGNAVDKDQIRGLCAEIQALHPKSLPALISVDQEGGRVQRFRQGFTRLPPADQAGKLSDEDLRVLTEIQARELRNVGINLNFAPVADVNTNPNNPIIGDRAYSSDPTDAARAVRILVQEHLKWGVLPCIKHFPGHGDTHLDTHLALARVDTSLSQLQSREWLPFQAGIGAGAPLVMTAHIVTAALDPDLPATLSSRALDPLRTLLGFSGLIVSDDMQMKAIEDNYGKDEALVRALQAGCDLLLTNTEEGHFTAVESLRKSVRDGLLSDQLMEKKLLRVRELRRGLS